jgi:monoamine oxidase
MQGRRVAIIGAGLAGLAAAHELGRAGSALTVLDGRARAGGRVWSTAGTFAESQFAELGGEFIDEDHEEMRRLAGTLGLELVEVLATGFAQRLRSDDGYRLERGDAWGRLQLAFAPLIGRYQSAGGDDASAAVREIARQSVRGWLRHQDAGSGLHAIADAFRGLFLADPEELSALPLVELFAEGGSPARKKTFRVAGGTSRLVDALLAATPARLLLRHHVRAIVQIEDRVLVRADDEHGRAIEVEADAAVVALPASTLRDVELQPALPEDQQQAIRAVRYGRATKVVIQCEGRGLGRRRARAFATDTHLGAFWDSTEGQPGSSHAVITFLGGGSASQWLQDRVRDGPRDLLDDLCWLGMDGTPITASQTWTWEDDPFARGGYAVWDPSFDPAWRALLSRRAGRLVFAGEHTSQQRQGYMEGAVESGLRAARQVREDF